MICIDIAREAKTQYEAGVPIPEIREIVEEKYGQGRVGTPTPLPPADERAQSHPGSPAAPIGG